MDPILDALNSFRQGIDYPLYLPYLRFGVMVVVGCCVGIMSALTSEDVLADIRSAIRHAGLTDKDVTAFFAVTRGNCSDRLRGERPLTIQKLASLPVEFWQWWAVTMARRHGVPVEVTTGARLARRQARMALNHDKAGAA